MCTKERKKTEHKLLPLRIKSILKNSKKIGKIHPKSPQVLGRFLELFLTDIIGRLFFLAKKKKIRKIKTNFLLRFLEQSRVKIF